MAPPLIVPLPPGLELGGGCLLRVTALDAATGDRIQGVFVANVTFEVAVTSGQPDDFAVGPFMLVPGPHG